MSFSSVSKSLEKAIDSNKRERQEFFANRLQERLAALDLWYQQKGDLFLEWAKTEYHTYSGESLSWREPFLEEFYLLMGNPWIETLFIEKGAQMGFSECLIAIVSFFLGKLNSPIGLGFEQQDKMQDMVGSRIQPSLLDHCEVIKILNKESAKITGRIGLDSKKAITVAGVKASFFYAGVKGAKSATFAKRQASSSLSSFSAIAILGDEIELWPEGVLDVARQRMAASSLPTKPLRAGSTPGHEGGIVDTEMRRSRYLFQWHIICDHCQTVQAIDAFNNLFFNVEIKGNLITEYRYISLTGRPYCWHKNNPEQKIEFIWEAACNDQYETNWFYSDPLNKVESAYIGCKHCKGIISRTILDTGRFICINSQITLRELCQGNSPIHESVGLRLPKLVSVLFNAPEKIRSLLRTRNPADEIQQGLGKAISLGGGKISLDKLLDCVSSNQINDPDLIVAGIDQGRSSLYVVVQKWKLADLPDKDRKWSNALKQVIWYGEISFDFEILDQFVADYNIDLIGMDNEPEYNSAVDYALKHLPTGTRDRQVKGQVYLFDQMELKGEGFRRTLRKTKSGINSKKEKTVPVYLLDRTYGLDAVRDRIYRKLQTFPLGTRYDPRDPRNFFYHYLTSDRLPDGKWLEPPGAPDHYHHADSFGEAVVLASLYEPGVKRFSFGTLPVEPDYQPYVEQ